MRRLFNENDNWTPEAHELGIRIHAAIRPIVSEALATGVSIRDVELVALYEVSSICSTLKVWIDIERRAAAKGKPK